MTGGNRPLDPLEFGHWRPHGTLDAESGVWYIGGDVVNDFPESGVEVFDSVDQDSFWFAHRNQMIESALDQHGTSGPLLEVGSGSGVVAGHLAAAGHIVACVEPHATGAIRAAQRGVTASFCGDLAALDLPARSVPNLGLFDVIEHLASPSELLQECRRVLRPDGTMLLTVPAHQWLWSEFDEWNGHHIRYSTKTLHTELDRAGFETVLASYFFFPLLLPAAVSRVLLGRFRKPRTTAEIERNLAAELAPAAAPVEWALRTIHRAEAAAFGHIPIPTGTSIIAVARPRSGR